MRSQVGENCAKDTTEEEITSTHKPVLARAPLVSQHSGDEESRHGATPRHCYNKKKENGWPRSQTAERKTSPNSYVLGARRRQTKDGEAKEDMAKHLQRRPRRDGRQLAWSPPDRQRP